MKTETLGTATYSPEDNKLRFYPFARLAREDYDKIKAAGFIWAPKQELFVAPMWTPDREDLLVEWCGEIGDEDKSLVERAEERADRFEDYSESRQGDAESARKAVAAIADGIPLGQPILVGHHSEKRARKDAERIENGMRRAVKMWEQSKYWTQRAAGAIHHAKYLERPDVRARRIKKIEADKRRMERETAIANKFLAYWNNQAKELTMERATAISNSGECHVAQCFPLKDYPRVPPASQYEGTMGLWSALTGAVITAEQAKAIAVEQLEDGNCRRARWILHYENRLAYERAMLNADGGTVAERTGPEVGGACKCWVNRGGWSKIQKVNKVSVTVLDNWGNTNADGSPCRDFTRTIPFDKLSGVMTKAQVELARLEKRIYAEDSRSFAVADASPEAPKQTEIQIEQKRIAEFDAEHMAELDAMSHGLKFSALGQEDRGIIRAALRVKLGIEIPENNGTPPPQPVSIPKPYQKPERTAFDDMKESLKAGVQVVSAPQLFPTPPEIAKQVIALAEIPAGVTVLEPSAGTGNLVKAIRDTVDTEVVGVEINSELCRHLEKRFQSYELNVRCADFLTCNGDLGKFDRIVMNPPFERGSDIRHIKHAMTFLNPGGRLVAICANGPKQHEELEPLCDQWIDLPTGSFESQGTGVNTAMIVINK